MYTQRYQRPPELTLTFDLYNFVFNFENNEKVQEILFGNETEHKNSSKMLESKGVRLLKELGYDPNYTFG